MEELHAEMVRAALASHLDVPPESFGETQDLERDLGLDPLDLVLIMLRLEEVVGVEFPLALLDEAKTVGDVLVLVRSWLGVVPVLRRASARATGLVRERSNVRTSARMRALKSNLRRPPPDPGHFLRGRHDQ